MLNGVCAGDDCEETAPEDVHRTSCVSRRYEVGRVRRDRAVRFEGGVCTCEAREEGEEDEAARHRAEFRPHLLVIYRGLRSARGLEDALMNGGG